MIVEVFRRTMPSATTGREYGGHCRMCLFALVLVGTILATFGPHVAEAWPSPRYDCSCRNCYGGFFVCRNRDYTCNCAACSCYSDVRITGKKPTRHKNGNNNHNSSITIYIANHIGRITSYRRSLILHINPLMPTVAIWVQL